MANLSAPPGVPITNQYGMAREWMIWFTQVWRAIGGPVRLSSYTVSTVPDATLYEGSIIYVSNETGGKTIAFSDGTSWRRAQDRTIIS